MPPVVPFIFLLFFLLPPSNLFVYLAKFDSPTRSDLTSRSLLIPLSPLRPFVLALLSPRFPLLVSRFLLVFLGFLSVACRLLYPVSRFHRFAIVVGFFSRHPVLPRRSLPRLANRPAELGVHFLVVGKLPKISFSTFFCYHVPPRNEAYFLASIHNF